MFSLKGGCQVSGISVTTTLPQHKTPLCRQLTETASTTSTPSTPSSQSMSNTRPARDPMGNPCMHCYAYVDPGMLPSLSTPKHHIERQCMDKKPSKSKSRQGLAFFGIKAVETLESPWNSMKALEHHMKAREKQ